MRSDKRWELIFECKKVDGSLQRWTLAARRTPVRDKSIFWCRIPKCLMNWRYHLTLTSHVRCGVENRELLVCLDKESVRSCWSGQLQEPGEHCITPVPGPQAQKLWVKLVWMAPRYVDFWKSPKMTLTCSQEWAPWLTYKLTVVPKGNRLCF